MVFVDVNWDESEVCGEDIKHFGPFGYCCRFVNKVGIKERANNRQGREGVCPIQ